MTKHSEVNKRSYPPFWEKFIPLFLGIMGLIITIMIVIVFAVVFGFFPA
jgi:hypothetical protein